MKLLSAPVKLLALVIVIALGVGAYFVKEEGTLNPTEIGNANGQAARAGAPNAVFFQLTAAQVGMAKQQLEMLEVKPLYEQGYDRKEFGSPWTDGADGVAFAGNGCKTRDDILKRDLIDPVVQGDCTVVSGRLWNPYGTDGNPGNDWIDFTKGGSVPVDIDHIVALKNAWGTGAYLLTREQRTQLANDPINLVAVRGRDNRVKGDKAVDEWVPVNRDIHCGYAASQIQIKARYHLWVTPSERHVLEQMLDTCPAGV